MRKTIEGHMARKFTVENDWARDVVHVNVTNTGTLAEIDSRLMNDTAVELGETIIQAAGKGVFTYEGRLPSVEKVGGEIQEPKTGYSRSETFDSPENVMRDIKALIAIHNALVKGQEERKAREAEEALAVLKLENRRNDLAVKFCGIGLAQYKNCTEATQKAIDYIIELEDKNK